MSIFKSIRETIAGLRALSRVASFEQIEAFRAANDTAIRIRRELEIDAESQLTAERAAHTATKAKLADAWNEGFSAGWEHRQRGGTYTRGISVAPNPYEVKS
jgi:hypothetical protein